MALKSLSTAELLKELQRREKGAGKLEAKRSKLLTELTAIDTQLAHLGVAPSASGRPVATPSAPSTGKRTRARNAVNLPDAIAMAMEVGAVVSPAEASDLVTSNGFKTTSSRFNMMVSNALAKDTRFRRLSRGQYERIG
ncbi:MAG: hypothetical protein ACI9EF_000264 [Pseudohongiellaceae bacterium]|jgi:hypothetical protein